MAARRHAAPFIALAVAGCIVYASLRPFEGWSPWLEGTLWFPFMASSWGRFRAFDFLVNLLIYCPLGWSLTFSFMRDGTRSIPTRRVLACALGLSILMETAQMWLPMRQPSMLDVIANGLGALIGIGFATLLLRHTRYSSVSLLRDRWFLPGRRGDLGLCLLGLWLVAHLNPVIPLYASTFLPPPALANDLALQYLEVAQTALNFLGVALFADLLLLRRYEAGWMVVGITATALASKAIAAWLLLKPIAWAAWLRPPVALGFALGAIVMLGVFRFERRWKNIVANVCLLVGLALTLLIPEWFLNAPPLRLFNQDLGHLLNFNGLTHGLLWLWPVLASIYLATGSTTHDLPQTVRRF